MFVFGHRPRCDSSLCHACRVGLRRHLADANGAFASAPGDHSDLLGSIRTTTDTTGAVTSDADYNTYGQPQAVTADPTSTITRFGYAGEYTDPTGYLYLCLLYTSDAADE